MLTKIFLNLFDLKNSTKLTIAIIMDIINLSICFFIAMALRYENFYFMQNKLVYLILPIVIPITIYTFLKSEFYLATIRFVSNKTIKSSLIGIFLSGLTMLLSSQFLNIPIPRSVPFIFMVILFLSLNAKRFLIKYIYVSLTKKIRKSVAIYGANDTGLQLLQALSHNKEYQPIFFIDKKENISGKEIGGLKVYDIENSHTQFNSKNINSVLISIPNTSRSERRKVIESLERYSIKVQVIPSISDVIENKVSINELPNISIEDLLERGVIPPKKELMEKNIKNQVVMVTGAGGSIGSELCRQIRKIKPKKLILLDFAEYSLYNIDKELKTTFSQSDKKFEIIPLLGNILDNSFVENIFKNFTINTIFHVAAYKHVPLVEQNIISSIRNNVFGTQSIVKKSIEANVKNFIFVSTDKSVRPTNFMGATKRVAEMICKSYDKKQSITKFSMVRFGNVMGSSGSVISIFEEQIKSGGPITVTHKDVTRYFMTIKEAAQLVIQASSMAKGGDVFLLDMGKPIKILDIAKKMASLHGLKPYIIEKDHINPKGDIGIEIIGLRPGEKLYEELLISNNPSGTVHPRIMTAQEDVLSSKELNLFLSKLKSACDEINLDLVLKILQNYLKDFTNAKISNDNFIKSKKSTNIKKDKLRLVKY